MAFFCQLLKFPVQSHKMYDQATQKELYDLSRKLLETEVDTNQLDDLKRVIVFHEWKYYVENNPVMSDFEYDQLFDKLKSIEDADPSLITPDSPTQRVSSDLVENIESVKHLKPMLSLKNSYNEEDLFEFDRQIKKLIGLDPDSKVDYAVEPKFDGGSISLTYENDLLTRGATRGNGVQGEEITANMKSLPSIPLRAKFSDFKMKTVEIRGEAIIRKDIFKKVNKVREKEGETLFANPRNAATGGLRTKNPNETRKRGIVSFIYHLSFAEDENGIDVLADHPTHFGLVQLCGSLGFKIPFQEMKLCHSIKEAHEFCQFWEDKRESYPYEIDGMVIKVNNRDYQRICGSTSHHPRWAIAYKFKAKQATTKLLNVEYQVGKIGSITPVAKLEPVQLAGVTVSSVSLHNEEFIIAKDLRLGDTVLVERAGDVIPYIVKAMDELRDGSEQLIEFPLECPINDQKTAVKLVQVEGEAAWRCPKCICGVQDLRRIIFHVSKDGMDIDGFGKSIVEKFFVLGWIKDISDVYNLDFDEIQKLEGFGELSAKNLKQAIEKAKGNSITRVLQSLSIHHLGKRASKLIAENINHILDLRDWNEERFLEIKDIGPVVAENVSLFFGDEDNVKMLERMEERGVNFFQTDEDKPAEVVEGEVFSGKSILFTGTLQQMGRKEAQQKAIALGAKPLSAVSSKLDILVVGEKAGSKLKKAQALGTVQILTEDEFLALIQ